MNRMLPLVIGTLVVSAASGADLLTEELETPRRPDLLGVQL